MIVLRGESAAVMSHSEERLDASQAVHEGDLLIDLTARDDHAVLMLKGELDVYTSPRLRGHLADAIANGHRNIVIDLAHVRFIDSTGIGVLVGALKRACQHGGEVALRSPRPGTRRALEITGLTEIFVIT